ncbi:MAG: phosphate ABC transporter substrate-binding protein PstS [Thermogemmatispora sp.]|uniref:phosphate ABC transporter substrate-binding protein PstS n=1 Tax=Thermogemmatispora sp. TaxID=1968838 RepID=UPI001D867157|nr:phosphate ABC transporter substrate-binding protein PstS [Thermogemmatispora sp.]MBX5452017.1 phosphate ABC transporter substrate-binding protein PstS [Thermogemmatispora sp.]
MEDSIGLVFRLRHSKILLLLFSLLLLSPVLGACGNSSTGVQSSGTCPSVNLLTGAGSTFDFPLFSKMFTEYAQIGCHVQVNYQSVGSGAGKTQFLQQTVDFGASDGPMTDEELAKSQNGPILHIPVTIGAEAISYNLTSVPGTQHVRFTGPLLADIYLGKVTSWDDPRLKQLNPDVSLPHQAITVIHRSDGSGTTAIFTKYLATVSEAWASQVGAGSTVNWPVGVGAKGNEGVAAAVRTTAGAIGYIELAYVLKNNMQYGLVQNRDGAFTQPSLETAKADAANATNIPADLRFYIVNEPGKDSYPITGYSWVLVYQNQRDPSRGEALANLLWWMVHDGQRYAPDLAYVPLPETIVQRDEAQIKKMRCGDQGCYRG